MTNFDSFIKTVLDNVTKASDREEKAIRQELLDHLTDSRDALMERGLTQEEAEMQAVERMGDPKEIGKAWNKQLSRFWRWTGFLLGYMCIGMTLALFFQLFGVFGGLYFQFQGTVRRDAWKLPEGQIIAAQELDIEQDFGRHTVKLYRMELCETEEGHNIHLFFYNYPDNPLHQPIYGFDLARATTCNGQQGLKTTTETSHSNFWAWSTAYPIEEGAPTAQVEIDLLGNQFSAEIPLDWEVTP